MHSNIPPMRRTAKAENRTESITLRVEKRVLDKLREEAERNSESVNVLGNQVFKFYVNWHSVAVDSGFMYIDKKNLSRILDKLTEDDIDQILDEYFDNEFVGRIKMLTGNKLELDRFLRAMEGWMLGSGFRYRHTTNNGIQTYVIQHNVGKNAAYYIKSYWKKSLEILKVKTVEVKSTNDILWVEFVT
jgi:hypothetical protein